MIKNKAREKRQSLVKKIGANKMLTIGIIITLIVVVTAIFAFAFPSGPNDPMPSIRLTKPFSDSAHILGTDAIGRDLLVRILYGIRTSLVVGICAVGIGVLLGVFLGIVAGFSKRGIADTIIMRLVDIQMGLPFIVLAIIILTMVTPSIPVIIVVLSLSFWPGYARSVRSTVMLQKNMEYIVEARLLGASKWRIYWKYVGKNLIPTILPLIPLDIAGAIISESLLGFMQLGVKPPTISVGSIMADAMSYTASNPWYITIPGVCLLILILGFNFIGDSLQIKLNSKMQR